MLIRSTPFSDEQDHGYLGRIMRINGISKKKDIDRLLRVWAGVPGSDFRKFPFVELLAKFAGMSVTEFVIQHTSLPLRRGISSYLPELKHGCESNKSMLWSTAMRPARSGAYFCETCITNDIKDHKLSHWHRAHQIPGEFWCREHSLPLRYLDNESAFLKMPNALVEESSSISQDWAMASKSNPIVERYIEICKLLMSRECPFAVNTVSSALRERAQTLGFQVNCGTVKFPLLSDLAINECGRPWLASVLPKLAKKKIGELSFQLDGAFFLKTSSSSVVAYAIAAALLFDSANEACVAFSEAESELPNSRPRTNVNLSTDDLLTVYIKTEGDYRYAVESFDCSYQTLANRYLSLGLPNLATRRGIGRLEAAAAFFLEKRSFSDSAQIGDLSQNVMEYLIRNAGPLLKKALQAMLRSGGVGSGVRRNKCLTPADIQEYDFDIA